MSALTKPFLKMSTSSSPLTLIPVELLVAIDKIDVIDPNNAANSYSAIQFKLKTYDQPVVVKYPGIYSAAKILRDASLAAIIAATTTTVV